MTSYIWPYDTLIYRTWTIFSHSRATMAPLYVKVECTHRHTDKRAFSWCIFAIYLRNTSPRKFTDWPQPSNALLWLVYNAVYPCISHTLCFDKCALGQGLLTWFLHKLRLVLSHSGNEANCKPVSVQCIGYLRWNNDIL